MAAPDMPPAAPLKASRRRPPLLLVLVVTALLVGGFVLADVAVMAALDFWPRLVGFLVGLLFALVLPMVLAVRALFALRRRGSHVVLRLLVPVFLVFIVHLATVGVVTTWVDRGSGDFAAVSYEALAGIGGIPVVSSILETHAEQEKVLPRGFQAALDRNKPAPTGSDGGPADVVTAGDGGLAAVPAVVTPWSPRRATGRVVRTAIYVALLEGGDKALVVDTLPQGGLVSRRVLELAPFADKGSPTAFDAADDGSVVAVLGGGDVVQGKPGKALLAVPGLSRGAKVGSKNDEIRAVKHVAIAPGGAILATVELAVAKNAGEVEVDEALLVLRPGEAQATVVKRAGDVVPNADEGSVAKSFALKRPAGDGSVLVLETYLEGGTEVSTSVNDATFTMNPMRLLSGRIDAPRALVEVARTGDALNGIEAKSLQAILDAGLFPDGRVLFDGNFVEEGAAGWLFTSRAAGSVYAVEPALFGKDAAPWPVRAPRAMHLTVEPDGAFAFATRDGAILLGRIDRPAESKQVLRSAEAFRDDGTKAGVVIGVGAPLLAKGGEYLIAQVDLQPDDGPRKSAIVLASRADLQAQKVQVLVEEGGTIPAVDPKSPARKVRSVVLDGREDLLWKAGPKAP